MMAAFGLGDRRVVGQVRTGMGWFGMALALAVVTCGEDAGDPGSGSGGEWDLQPERRWQLTESLRIGELLAEGPAAFGDVRCIAVDPMDRIWVVDELAQEIQVFGADGAYVRTVGRKGEGPGEFRRIGDVFPGPGAEIWVEDRVGRRYEIFDTAGDRIGGHPTVLANVGNARRSWTRQGLLVVSDPVSRTTRFFERVEGELRDTGREAVRPNRESPEPFGSMPALRFEFTGPIPGYTSGQVPFSPRSRGFFGSDLDRWGARQIAADEYEVRRTSLETGDDLLAITHRYEPAAIPDSLRRAAADSVVENYTQGGSKLVTDFDWTMVPRHYRAFEGLHVSASGEVWVRRTLAGGIVGFDVFASDGRYLGQPGVPASFVATMNVQVITESGVYVIDTDDVGAQYVVRFDVVGAGGGRTRTGVITGC